MLAVVSVLVDHHTRVPFRVEAEHLRRKLQPFLPDRDAPIALLEGTHLLPLLVIGVSEADLLRSYPTLRAEDLANAWAYVRSHRDEIERQIQDNEAD